MHHSPHNTPRNPDQRSTSLRIIVADDDRRMREFYSAVLSRLGHNVVGVAADGLELIETCRNNEADLVLTDIRMPGMDGIKAANIVSKEIEIPFLFVSAYHDDLFEGDSPRRFTYGVLLKPIKQEDLANTIPAAMRRFREH